MKRCQKAAEETEMAIVLLNPKEINYIISKIQGGGSDPMGEKLIHQLENCRDIQNYHKINQQAIDRAVNGFFENKRKFKIKVIEER